MNASPDTQKSAIPVRPPRLIQSLVGGFNATASNISLILLPVAVDLLLWFGPRLRLKALMEPAILDLFGFLRQSSPVEMGEALDGLEQLWGLFLTQYNLLSTLSTFPVGVPSMMAGQLPASTPIGSPPVYEVGSFAQMLLSWLGLWLTGLVLGSLFFSAIARNCKGSLSEADCKGSLEQQAAPDAEAAMEAPTAPRTPQASPMRPGVLAWQTVQLLALTIILIGIALVLMIPSLFMASFLGLISPILAQAALLLISFSAVWFLVPLIFSPHGIFLCGQSVFSAMLNSARVVRFALPGTGLFLLVLLVLNQGLGLLWRMAPDTSWMALVGVLGHAFVTTSLLAATFVYYRNGLAYVQAIRRQLFIRTH